MTSKLTRERLEKIKSWRETYGAGSNVMLPAEEAEELARIALAAMDSEPVAYTEKHEISNMHATGLYLRAWPAGRARNAVEGYTIPLYRHAQPVPVVPELRVDWQENEFSAGWNACRAAMLAAAPQSPGSYPATVPGKWITVSERLPDEGDHVLVSDGVGMEVSWIRGREWKKLRHIYSEDVTHWMQLPAAPQEVKK